ncbi:hypothetical protein EOL70_14545 [Leucothrix sargassi]|nr:hypothetical protein EOL70_14545 [Leucothrix sargassi]
MNRLLTTGLVSLSLLTLSACNSSDSSSSQTQTVATPAPSTPATTVNCEAKADPISSFQRIQLHYGLLRDTTFQNNETGGLLPLTVTADAAAGSTVINVDSTISLVEGQLITYLGENFDYYVAEIESLTSNTITLTANTAVVSKISSGSNAWNFYNTEYDANHFAHKAIADLSYRESASIVDTNATHVIIGDDWLNDTSYTDRLQRRYPSATIVNKASAGNGLCDLLANFESDVTANNPQYVWISSSISDNRAGVSQENYKIRLQDLIYRVQSIGATAIVFDAVAGSPQKSADGVVTDEILANRYSTQVQSLLNEASSTTEEPVVVTPPTEPEEEPVVVTPPTEPETPTNSACSATAEPIQSFTRIPLHYGYLNAVGFVSSNVNGESEIEGLNSYTVTADASLGSQVINLSSTSGLVVGQLVSYLETDGVFRAATIESLTETQVTINEADRLISGISAGETFWNFYEDPDHPNSIGLRGMADFGLGYVAGIAGVNEATHVLLGDSWFTNNGFEERLVERLPSANIINLSEGGNTLCELLEVFDSGSVASQAPDYVWINSGVNDYFQDVSPADYRVRMQNLIAKVQSLGAVAVVYDSATAPNGVTDSGVSYISLSGNYAGQLESLFNEANSN